MNRDEDSPDFNPDGPDGRDDHGGNGDHGGNSGREDRGESGHSPLDPPSSDGYERGAGSGRGEEGAAPDRYRPTNHPEDAPGGFNPGYGTSNYGGAGASAYSGYEPYPGTTGDGQANANAYGGYETGTFGQYAGPDGNGRPLETADGRINIMRAVRFGFKSVFSNPAVWILGTVIVGLAFLVLSIMLGFLMVALDPQAVMDNDPWAPVNIIINVVISVLAWLIFIAAMRGALIETDGRRARLKDFFHPINAGQTAILLIIFTLLGMVLSLIVQSDTQSAVMVNELTGEVALDSGLLGRLALFVIIAGLINPLYSYWVYYTSDGRENAVGAAKNGFADAVRNYPKLLLYSVLSGVVIMVFGPLTLFLGLVIFLPVSVLISAHLYRQMSGGKVPVDSSGR